MKRFLPLLLAAVLPACERRPGRIGDITFLVDREAALARAKAEGKPVFIEFRSDN